MVAKLAMQVVDSRSPYTAASFLQLRSTLRSSLRDSRHLLRYLNYNDQNHKHEWIHMSPFLEKGDKW